MSENNILIVDDDPNVRETLADILEEKGYNVSTAESGATAVAASLQTSFDLAAVDIKLPDVDGMDLIEKLKTQKSLPICIIITGNASLKNAVNAVERDVSGYFIKPFDIDDVIGRIDEMLQRRRLEKELKESEEKYRAVVETSTDAIVSVNERMEITGWNAAAVKLLGYAKEEILGKCLRMLIPPKYRKKHTEGFNRFLETGQKRLIGKTVEIEALHKSGAVIPVELSLSMAGERDSCIFTAIIRDITERKRDEEKLKRSNDQLHEALEELKKAQRLLIRQEKLASLGALSAGVAHEIKNPLNIISTSVQLLKMNEGVDDETMEAYSTINEQVNRAVKITENLREFARERKPEITLINVHEFMEKTISLVEYEMKVESINITRDFEGKPVYIAGDPDLLAQVFLNIINNARDSMNEKKSKYSYDDLEKMGWEGRLSVGTKQENGIVRVSFRDTGVGMSSEALSRVFDPFFTTKPDKGTGLGMSIAYGIIENHDGTMDVASEEGEWSEFVIKLPLLKQD